MILETLINVASAVGGISGLLAVLILWWSRKDAAAAQLRYEALVQMFVRELKQIVNDQQQALDQYNVTFQGIANELTASANMLRSHDERTQRMAANLYQHRHAMEPGDPPWVNGDSGKEL